MWAKNRSLVNIKPPAEDFVNLKGVENMIAAIGSMPPAAVDMKRHVSYEITSAKEEGVRFGVRGPLISGIRRQVEAHYPQARISCEGECPLTLREGEIALTTVLTTSGNDMLPIRTFDDEDVTTSGSDPMLSIIGAMSDLEQDERVVVRALTNEMPHNWSERYRQQAMIGSGSANEQQRADENTAQRAATAAAPPGQTASAPSKDMSLGALLALVPLAIMGMWVTTSDLNMTNITASNWVMVAIKLAIDIALTIAVRAGIKYFQKTSQNTTTRNWWQPECQDLPTTLKSR